MFGERNKCFNLLKKKEREKKQLDSDDSNKKNPQHRFVNRDIMNLIKKIFLV